MRISMLLFDHDILSAIYVTCVDVRCSSCSPRRIHVLQDTNSSNIASGGICNGGHANGWSQTVQSGTGRAHRFDPGSQARTRRHQANGLTESRRRRCSACKPCSSFQRRVFRRRHGCRCRLLAQRRQRLSESTWLLTKFDHRSFRFCQVYSYLPIPSLLLRSCSRRRAAYSGHGFITEKAKACALRL